MAARSPFEVFAAPSARERLTRARDFVRSFPAGTEVVIVGPSRAAVDDFVREVARDGAAFGLHRFSFWQLVSTVAAAEIATEGLAPATPLGMQSVAARAAFQAMRAGKLARLDRVAAFPGFPAALAATLDELRREEIPARDLRHYPELTDLAELADLFEKESARTRTADRAALLKLATWAWHRPQHVRLRGAPLLLLDLPVAGRLEEGFLAPPLAGGPSALATVPAGDERTLDALRRLGAVEAPAPRRATAAEPALARLRSWVFAADEPPVADKDDSVRFLSAPGEARECVEIARHVLREAARGVRLDEMAVLLRAPETYSAHVETAFRRAGIAAFFSRGARRPDPSGRAFLALLACAAERLSANRFAEYLSFAEVPDADAAGAPPSREVWVGAMEETLGPAGAGTDSPGSDGLQLALPFGEPASPPPPPPAADAPVQRGALRAPWRWERFLVEAAVIGGQDRWRRRLRGLERELVLKIERLSAEEPESARLFALERSLAELGHLERFALPLIEQLAAFPREADWGEWLRIFELLVPRALRHPERVLEVLAEMRPMSTVGPATLDEVRAVLAERLSTLEEEPPPSRWGRVFVGTPESARGRVFRVVFAPGLAERLFPRRPREDPLLLDDARETLGGKLRLQKQRDDDERLLLQLAAGAAGERLVLSYPRLDVAEARPRVPSFYMLDVARAIHGALPAHEELAREAEREGGARLAWPSPGEPDAAIDAVEHDLAVLGELLRSPARADLRGRARYLLSLNPHLGRSLRSRWVRWRPRWAPQDGIMRVAEHTREALAAYSPREHVYSATALERFAACPYRFFLSAVHRLEPREEAQAPVQLDPLTKGKLVHEVQARALRRLRDAGALPVLPETLRDATAALDSVLDDVAQRYDEDIAPAIPRVWQDEIAAIRADLRIWLRRLAHEAPEWTPVHFEWTFGLPADGPAEPRSVREPVELPGGWKLRGAVDLLERREDGALRVTDHKTGADRTNPGFVVGGGETLQPVLYSLAVERALGETVSEARLSFCTSRGSFADRRVQISDWSRLQGKQALELIGRAIERGVLVPAPRGKTRTAPGACSVCDFRRVCGPNEERRIQGKDQAMLEELHDLRELP
ncbi:MAG: PD-(D/E)XK nuclease family protein [Candidatus Eiseniibacteriota bacterium]